MAKKFRRDPLDFFWLHKSSLQAKIRDTFALPLGVSSILAIKAGKRPRYTVYDGGHVHRTGAVEMFVEDILAGLEPFRPMANLPTYDDNEEGKKEDKEQQQQQHVEL